MSAYIDKNRRLFLSGPSLGARTLLFVILSIAFMVSDIRFEQTEQLRRAISTTIYPLRAIAHAPYKTMTGAKEGLRSRSSLQAENVELRQQVQDSSFEIQRLHRLESENDRLRALLESAQAQQLNLQMTEILRVSLDPNRHNVILNQGQADNLSKGQAVIDATGLVGQIVRTDPMQSEVTLITDPNHATPIEVNRNGLRSIAYGTGESQRLSLPYIAQNADITEGDLLVTSGLGGRFPAGIPVAEITQIIHDTARNFLIVTAAPMAALEQSRQVAVVSESQVRLAERGRRGANGLAKTNTEQDK